MVAFTFICFAGSAMLLLAGLIEVWMNAHPALADRLMRYIFGDDAADQSEEKGLGLWSSRRQ